MQKSIHLIILLTTLNPNLKIQNTTTCRIPISVQNKIFAQKIKARIATIS